MMEELRKEVRTNYKEYLLPVLCLVVGVLIGFLLSPVKSGRVTLFSGNTVGSNNGSRNTVDDMLIGGQKGEHLKN